MINYRIGHKLKERKAQILLPSVLLAPIFILLIYLLFETAKVSMTKVRNQFALDNAAYSQMSSASTYLNAMAMLNGPLAHRVMLDFSNQTLRPSRDKSPANVTIFDLFYKGGGVPTIGPDYENGLSPQPPAESNNWGINYYSGDWLDEDGGDRSAWMKENPPTVEDNAVIPVMSKKLTNEVFFQADHDGPASGAIVSYLETYVRLNSIYKSQDYVYKEVSKNAVMFREAYFLNVNDCKRSDCARQSASQIRQFLNLQTKPFELNKVRFYVSEAGQGFHVRSYPIEFDSQAQIGEKLFQFAYLTPTSRSKLKSLSHGVLLKQTFKLPRNHFHINLTQKYKPYGRNRIVLSCPHNGNNCVWPDPLPKYSITLEP